MKTFWPKILFAILVLAFWSWHLPAEEGAAQEKSKTDTEKFVNLGLISFSPNYVLGKDAGFIVFKVRNNATRPISNIFGWVYKFSEEDTGKNSNFVLVNNPNQGGALVNGGAQAPGEVADWRFPLIKGVETAKGSKGKYTLKVDPKSIFFGKAGLAKKPEGKSKPAQKP